METQTREDDDGPVAEMALGLQIDVLGPLRAVTASGPVEIGAPKQRVLLALLALQAGRIVGVDELISGLWGDGPPRSAHKTLQTYVSGLRRALSAGTVRTSPGGYQLDIDGDQVDASRFERLLDATRRAQVDRDTARATTQLEAALALWRGPALVDVSDQLSVMAAAQRLDELRRVAAEDLVDLRLQSGGHQQLVADLEAAVAAEPLRERRWAQLMTALYRCGRQADALRAYRRLRDVLGDEIGIEPSADLVQLEQSILLQRPEVDWQPEPERWPEVPTLLAGAGDGTALRTEWLDRAIEGAPLTLLVADLDDDAGASQVVPSDSQATVRDEVTAVMRDEVLTHQGALLPATDGMVRAVFASAADAAAAAVGAQCRLGDQPGGGPSVGRCRLALHTGLCAEHHGDLVGATVNRTGRLHAAAHGGQILLSGVTADIVRAHLPEGASLRDLGAHRLLDLERPEDLFQLDIVGHDGNFAPLRSLDSPKLSHNLPIQPTSFIGREGDIAELRRLLAGSRLVTCTGPGGVGKTRLALQAVSELLDGSGDGVWSVELAGLSDPTLVPAFVAEAIGLREEPGRPTMERLVDALRHKHLLVLLDNCEHLSDACAHLATALLRSCEHVHLLATSRQPLGVGGETVFRVPSLSLPPADEPDSDDDVYAFEAVRLFAERAAAQRPGFAVDASNVASVVSVCRRVDGLPLAIELAAARLRSLSLTDIERRLEDRFRLLTGGSRTALPRQQTLRALIDWSYELLAEPERVALCRLAVFPGGFDLETAEAAVPHLDIDASDVIDLVTSLVDKSLLQADTTGHWVRYRFTETVRQYAVERLLDAGATEVRATYDAHADAMLEVAATAAHHLEAGSQLEWLERLDRDQDNLRSAFAYLRGNDARAEAALLMAADLHRYWWLRAIYREGLEMLEVALSHPGAQAPTGARAAALLAIGRMRSALGDDRAATSSTEEGLNLARRLDQRELIIDGMAILAHSHLQLGNSERALEFAANAVSAGRDLGALRPLGRALRIRGMALRSTGDTDAGRADLVESLSCYKSAGCLIQIAAGLDDLASAVMETGDLEQAERHALESYRLTVELRLDPDIPYVARTLATIHLLRGRWGDAKELAMKSLDMCRRTDDRGTVPGTILVLALCASAEDLPERAIVLHGVADACLAQGGQDDGTQAELRTADLARLRGLLGAATYDALYAEGLAVRSIDEAADFALAATSPTWGWAAASP